MSLQSPIGRVRGLGSAKEGVAHWWMQRLTSIALAPLSIFFMWLCAHLIGASYLEIRTAIAHPVIAVLLISFMVCLFYHGQLGLQVVIEDYIHHKASELALLVIVKFTAFLFAAASVLAIARIALSS
jgi:succinate dehydrogenase / fumarate reductase, membrane anchor subunit